jgi:NitT/TauT family transport system substrate-binding protein
MSDFTGLHIGIPGRFGATYTGFTTMLESADMTESDVNLEEIGFVAPEVFCVGAIDASVVYVNNEPLQIRNRAQNGDCSDVSDVDVMSVSDVIDLVSNGIISNQETIDTDPDFVGSMIAAYDAGMSLTINNPARAYLLSAAYIEGLPLDDDFRAALETLADEQDTFLESNPEREAVAESRDAMYSNLSEQFDSETLLQFEVLLASIPLWDAEQLGYTDAQSWLNMQDTLIALNQLEAPIELESHYSNDFLPEGD